MTRTNRLFAASLTAGAIAATLLGAGSADASRIGDCSTMSGRGPTVDCSWRATGDKVTISLRNRSSSRVTCKVDGIKAQSERVTLRGRGSDSVTLKRDPKITRWYKIACTSDAGQAERVDQSNSFTVRGD